MPDEYLKQRLATIRALAAERWISVPYTTEVLDVIDAVEKFQGKPFSIGDIETWGGSSINVKSALAVLSSSDDPLLEAFYYYIDHNGCGYELSKSQSDGIFAGKPVLHPVLGEDSIIPASKVVQSWRLFAPDDFETDAKHGCP